MIHSQEKTVNIILSINKYFPTFLTVQLLDSYFNLLLRYFFFLRIDNRVKCTIPWRHVAIVLVLVATIGSIITGMVYLALKAESKIMKFFHCLGLFFIDWFTDPLTLLFGKLKKYKIENPCFLFPPLLIFILIMDRNIKNNKNNVLLPP